MSAPRHPTLVLSPEQTLKQICQRQGRAWTYKQMEIFLLLLLLLLSRFSRSNSVRPHRRQPTRLPHPWDSLGKNTRVGCHFLLQCMKVKSESEVAQLCLTLSDPMDRSPPGSSIHGSFQARVLECGAIAFSGDISRTQQQEPDLNPGVQLRNLYAGRETTELDMEQQTGSKQEKEYVKAVYCHPAYLTSMQSTS